MSTTSSLEALFETRSQPQSSARDCGAACLSIVYRSLGQEVAPGEIWPAIAKKNQFGSIASTTHLMTQDALNRGFAAVAFQAKHPLLLLRRCRDMGIHAILNHRLRHDAPTGHYSALIDVDDHNVVLHDPPYDEPVALSHAELLELWQPHFPNSEIAGFTLIGVAPHAVDTPACDLCGTPIPSRVECPSCNQPVGLEPRLLLGCVNNACIARAWNDICCPTCDYTWDLTRRSDRAGSGAAVRTTMPPSAGSSAVTRNAGVLDLNKLFGELDKFSAYLLAIPAAAKHPEIKQQLDYITSCKEKIKPALTELLASREARRAQLAALVKAARERGEAYRQEEMQGRATRPNPPAPPLDGHALGRALLKNLGWGD